MLIDHLVGGFNIFQPLSWEDGAKYHVCFRGVKVEAANQSHPCYKGCIAGSSFQLVLLAPLGSD